MRMALLKTYTNDRLRMLYRKQHNSHNRILNTKNSNCSVFSFYHTIMAKLIYNIILSIVVWTLVSMAIYFYYRQDDIIRVAVDEYLSTHDIEEQ